MSKLFIPVAEPYVTEEDAKAVYECVRSGWLSMGKRVEAFEKAFANYVGAKYAVAMNNGTSTLHAALLVLGVGPGDEVIVPTLTYISSVNVILYVGATPVLCECNPETYNIEPKHVEHLITDKTKVIMPVDMNGLPVDYDAWDDFAKKHNVTILADSAEALGAVYKGKKIGSQATFHSFSFFPNKNMTTGEGGMLVTESKDLADRLRVLRNQGQDYRYHHIMLGYNYRMTDIQAALGLEQLGRIEWAMERKRHIVDFYNRAFEQVNDVSSPIIPSYVDRSSWYMYTVKLADHIDRNEIVSKLNKKGIETRCSFPPVHDQPYYRDRFGYQTTDFPISWGAWSKLLNLPVGLGIKDEELEFVVNTVKSLME